MSTIPPPKEEYLFPLIVILPLFLVAVNFWKNVIIYATYLRVFHEKNGSEFQFCLRNTIILFLMYKDVYHRM